MSAIKFNELRGPRPTVLSSFSPLIPKTSRYHKLCSHMLSLGYSDAPPSLETANQAQIDDLVQRNRTLEYTNTKLSEKLAVETNRSKEAVQAIQTRWHEQDKLTREECEDFLAYYRFVQLRTVSALETERLNVLAEQKALREEKLLRLQRDFRVAMFYSKERESEEKVLELEEENERMVMERKELASSLRNKLAEVIAQLRMKNDEIADLNSERDVVEVSSSSIYFRSFLTHDTERCQQITRRKRSAADFVIFYVFEARAYNPTTGRGTLGAL